MKNYFVLGAAVCVAVSMVSCKSSESAYKKAYEKAKQQQTTTEAPVQQSTVVAPTTTVAPVQTVTTTPVANESTRTESLTLVSGTGIKAFSVVVGSFSIKTNAENLQKKLEEVNAQKNLTNRVPAVVEIQKMIDQAKELPAVMEY